MYTFKAIILYMPHISFYICDTAGENQPTRANVPMRIIDQ